MIPRKTHTPMNKTLSPACWAGRKSYERSKHHQNWYQGAVSEPTKVAEIEFDVVERACHSHRCLTPEIEVTWLHPLVISPNTVC